MSRWHRFGPILEPIYAAPISYLRSVESKGHFYWKHKKEQFLIKGLQVRAEKLIGLSYKSSEENEKKLNAVAEELKLDPAHVRKAFRESLGRDPVNFIQDVITLQKTIRHYE